VQLKKNMELNSNKPVTWRHHRDEAGRFLESDRGVYDLVVLDLPPSAAEYRECRRILSLAFARVDTPGVVFVLAPFGSQFGSQDLVKAVHRSASHQSLTARMLEVLAPSADFPWLPAHPQGLCQGGYVVHLDKGMSQG
jgi:23S rRNA G2069 N7-methylase RlmK/C1962 C5-methylase RlmI